MALISVKDRISSKQVFSGEIFNVRVDTIQQNGGPTATREVVEHAGAVSIVALTDDNEVLMVKQYRYAIDDDLLELPAGRIESGEDRLETAKRELIEETGYSAKHWRVLPAIHPAPAFSDELLSNYLATGLEFVGANPDDDEELELVKIKLDDAWQMALTGKIRDSKTVAMLGIICHNLQQFL